MKRWQQRAQKLLEAARSQQESAAVASGAAGAGAAAGGKDGAGETAGLRGRIDSVLAELEGELKVSDVPEALELSAVLQVRRGQRGCSVAGLAEGRESVSRLESISCGSR